MKQSNLLMLRYCVGLSMGCCGKTVKNIIQGKINNALGRDFEFTRERIETCRRCDEKTWLSKSDYVRWLMSNGIAVLVNLDDLSVLPRLPKNDYSKGDGLYCAICKCFIPEKARAHDNTCPMGKWKQ